MTNERNNLYEVTQEDIIKGVIIAVGKETVNDKTKGFDGQAQTLKSITVQLKPESRGNGGLDSMAVKAMTVVVRSTDAPELEQYLAENADTILDKPEADRTLTIRRADVIFNQDFYVMRSVTNDKGVTSRKVVNNPNTGKPAVARRMPIVKFLAAGEINGADAFAVVKRIFSDQEKGGGFVNPVKLDALGNIDQPASSKGGDEADNLV